MAAVALGTLWLGGLNSAYRHTPEPTALSRARSMTWKEPDFRKATQRVYRSKDRASQIVARVLP